MTVIGDWWTNLVIREAFFGTTQFEEFRTRLGIATNILSSRLQRLVDEGVLAKVEYQSWPTRHDYRLTDKGLDLYHLPLTTNAWGQRWLKPSVRLRLVHRPCHTHVRPVLTCEQCAEPASRDDVEFAPPTTASPPLSGRRPRGS